MCPACVHPCAKASWIHASPPSIFSTAAANGSLPLPPINHSSELAAACLTPALAQSPLSVERHYSEDGANGDLLVRYELRHDRNHSGALELDALGVSMAFDQLFTGRSLAQVTASLNTCLSPCPKTHVRTAGLGCCIFKHMSRHMSIYTCTAGTGCCIMLVHRPVHRRRCWICPGRSILIAPNI